MPQGSATRLLGYVFAGHWAYLNCDHLRVEGAVTRGCHTDDSSLVHYLRRKSKVNALQFQLEVYKHADSVIDLAFLSYRYGLSSQTLARKSSI